MLNRGRVLLYIGAPLLCLQLLLLVFCFKAAQQKIVDFRGYYAAGEIVRTGQGHSLYNYDTQRIAQWKLRSNIDISNMRFVAPSYTALLFAPFSKLPFIPAYIAFFVMNLAAAAIALAIIRPFAPNLFATGLSVAAAVMFFTFFPLGIALGQGQLSVLLLLFYCSANFALERENSFVAGLLVSLALIKFQTALPVALLFLLWRKWKFVGGFILGASILLLISLFTMGVTHPGQIPTFITTTLAAFKNAPRPGLDPSAMTNIYGLASLLPGKAWPISLTAVSSVALLAWAARKPASLPFALMVALCVSVHLFLHDLTLLLLPLCVVVNRQIRDGLFSNMRSHAQSRRFSRHEVAAFVCVCIFLASPLQLWLMGRGWLPLLAIPMLVLTVTFRWSADADRQPLIERRTLDAQCAITGS